MLSFSSYCVKKLSDYLQFSRSSNRTGFARQKNSESFIRLFSLRQQHWCCSEKRSERLILMIELHIITAMKLWKYPPSLEKAILPLKLAFSSYLRAFLHMKSPCPAASMPGRGPFQRNREKTKGSVSLIRVRPSRKSVSYRGVNPVWGLRRSASNSFAKFGSGRC